ncbi:MAG: glycoside hydrolase family 57 protein [Thermosphaera sp.]
MNSLIPIRNLDGLEGYLVLNRPVFKVGEEARIHVILRSLNGEKAARYSITRNGEVIAEGNIMVTSGKDEIVVISVGVEEKPGEYDLTLKVNDAPMDLLKYIVIEHVPRATFLSFVWHNHQAPNYLPDKVYHSPWAFIHVYGEQLKPYGRGPYHYHTEMLVKHTDYRATYNLSPSLLYQWYQAIEEGVVFLSGEKINKDDERAQLIRETLNRYKAALKSAQIDVLSSIYAHTIAGYVSSVFNAPEIISEELKYGMEITRRVMEGYQPLGVWTPEMSFSMDLVDIYYDAGVEYTILDDKCHLLPAEGEKNSKYEPYLVLNSSSGKHITVFFRDQELSDLIGFKNEFESAIHAWRNAYETSLIISRKILTEKPRVLTLALDGENWMIFAKNPPFTAHFFDKLLIYLESLYDLGVLRMTSLRDVYENVPVRRILTKIPSTTWLCTYRKWRGQIQDQESYWVKVKEIYLRIKSYEDAIRGRDESSNLARWALWHALDSDYWWAEFWLPKVIESWLSEASRIITSRFSQVRIRQILVPQEIFKDEEFEAIIEVENNLEKTLSLELAVLPCDDGYYCGSKEIIVKPKGISPFPARVKLSRVGKQPLIALLTKGEVIIHNKAVEIEVKPSLPPNPS